eukprot:scaffold3256_cov444-Prasinococcus_capsulatus_cf.AAC.7
MDERESGVPRVEGQAQLWSVCLPEPRWWQLEEPSWPCPERTSPTKDPRHHSSAERPRPTQV